MHPGPAAESPGSRPPKKVAIWLLVVQRSFPCRRPRFGPAFIPSRRACSVSGKATARCWGARAIARLNWTTISCAIFGGHSVEVPILPTAILVACVGRGVEIVSAVLDFDLGS